MFNKSYSFFTVNIKKFKLLRKVGSFFSITLKWMNGISLLHLHSKWKLCSRFSLKQIKIFKNINVNYRVLHQASFVVLSIVSFSKKYSIKKKKNYYRPSLMKKKDNNNKSNIKQKWELQKKLISKKITSAKTVYGSYMREINKKWNLSTQRIL